MNTGNTGVTKNVAGTANNRAAGSSFAQAGGDAYGRIPLFLTECAWLRPISRLIAIWILSKPKGWVVYPFALQKALGISEKQWLSARRELITAGILIHKKYRSSDGKWRWESVFDVTPLKNAIPPLATRGGSTRGEAANIKIRDIEVKTQKNVGVEDGIGEALFDEVPFENVRQKTEAHCTSVQSAISFSPSKLSCAPKFNRNPSKSDIDELKKLHIGYVFEELGMSWYDSGVYVYGDTHHRAREAEDGHWLWIEVDGEGNEVNSGSAIDLLMSEGGHTQAQAINVLRDIYCDVMAAPESEEG